MPALCPRSRRACAPVLTGQVEPTARAVPFFCPFCGEEEIRPWGDDPDKGHGDWRCESCLRVFSVRYKGLTGRSEEH